METTYRHPTPGEAAALAELISQYDIIPASKLRDASRYLPVVQLGVLVGILVGVARIYHRRPLARRHDKLSQAAGLVLEAYVRFNAVQEAGVDRSLGLARELNDAMGCLWSAYKDR